MEQINRRFQVSVKDEQILRTAKEIVVKYIEIGRISPSAFSENFKTIYDAIESTVQKVDQDVIPPKPGENQ